MVDAAAARRGGPGPRGAVLVSGFDAFGPHGANPSGEVARRLHGRSTAVGTPVVGLELPTVFGGCIDRLSTAIESAQPSLVIALGLAASREVIGVERLAVNLDDARIADNAGVRPTERPVVAGAPAAYFSTLPAKAIVAALQAAGHPAESSWHAGQFVCNHLFYGLAHGIATRWPTLRGGFIHLPPWHEHGAAGLQRLVDAVSLAIDVAQSPAPCEGALDMSGRLD